MAIDHLTVEMRCTNAAFEGSSNPLEIARILRSLAADIEAGEMPSTLRDLNGNTTTQVLYGIALDA